MTLTINPQTRAFILTSDDDARAKAAGLTLSTRTRGAQGERMWYTSDYDKTPAFNPYAAVEFFPEGTLEAQAELARYWRDYEMSWAKETAFRAPCPPDQEFMDFQNAGVEYGVKHQNVLIGDEPGLGKTCQAIGIANEIQAKKVLVVCPASVRLGWQREIRNWSTLPRVSTYPIHRSADGVNPFTHYTIISYNLLRNLSIHDALCEINWDMLVLDEAHYLKTIDTIRTRAVFGGGNDVFATRFLAKHAGKIVGLTGTPLPNRPREAYVLARNMCWEAIDWMSADAFAYRFNPPGAFHGSKKIKEMRGRLPELRARLRCNFMVRRLKSQVLTQLPAKRYEMTHVEPNGAIKSVLAKERMLDFNPRDVLKGSFHIDGEVATVRREMGEAMVSRIIEHCRYLMDIVGLDKIMVGLYHKSVMNEFIDKMYKYKPVAIRGGMTDKQKDVSGFSFADDPDVRICVCQIESIAGVDGLQGAGCSHAVIGEPSWVPGNNEQFIDRIHRIGQLDSVLAQFLLAEGSFNELVLGQVLEKALDTNLSLDGV